MQSTRLQSARFHLVTMYLIKVTFILNSSSMMEKKKPMTNSFSFPFGFNVPSSFHTHLYPYKEQFIK